MNVPDAFARAAAELALESSQQDEVLTRVGQVTRSLHDNLCELGYDKLMERAAHDIPNARDRLEYVARMTEQAAQKVLNATESATPLQQHIEARASTLSAQVRAALDAPFSKQQLLENANRALTYLAATQLATSLTRQHLLDIMMAQDFQDLTGQVIKKVTELAHGLQQQLVQLPIKFAPPEIKRETVAGLLNGPQIHTNGNNDVVTDQGQVDDLLESLSF